MMNNKLRKTLRNLLMAVLVVIFLALVVSLTKLLPENPLAEYRLVLGVSFVVVAALARKVCSSCQKEASQEQ